MSTPPITDPALTEDYLDEDNSVHVIAIITVFPFVALTTVALRLYTRFKIVKNPSYEDYVIILAAIFSIATSVSQGFQVYYGMGRHIQALNVGQIIGSSKALFASIITYNFGLSLTKVSIILQYIRINVDSKVRKACWWLMYITLLNGVQAFATGILSCYPVDRFWDDRIPGGCVDKSALWYANAGINITQDIVLIVLPIFILRKLIMPRREKIGLILILGLGGFASVASVIRVHEIHRLAISNDVTFDNPGAATWSSMELNIGIICASLPTLRALLVKYFPDIFKSSIRNAGRVDYDYHHSDSTAHGELIWQPQEIIQHDSVIGHVRNDAAGFQRPPGTFLESDSETGMKRSADAGQFAAEC